VRGGWRCLAEDGECARTRAREAENACDGFSLACVCCASGAALVAVYRAAFGGINTVDVSLSFVLEARTCAELPEAVLAAVTVRHLDPPTMARPPHTSWPADAAAVPADESFSATTRQVAAQVQAALKQTAAAVRPAARCGDPAKHEERGESEGLQL
jgi:hypothetical protein